MALNNSPGAKVARLKHTAKLSAALRRLVDRGLDTETGLAAFVIAVTANQGHSSPDGLKPVMDAFGEFLTEASCWNLVLEGALTAVPVPGGQTLFEKSALASAVIAAEEARTGKAPPDDWLGDQLPLGQIVNG